MADRCADCGSEASESFGILRLCRACKAETIAAIVARRPDLTPLVGKGAPPGSDVRCWTCGATWRGQPLDECAWCVNRIYWQQQAQEAIERDRLRDYCLRLAEGDVGCLAAALDVAQRVKNGDGLVAKALAKGKAA